MTTQELLDKADFYVRRVEKKEIFDREHIAQLECIMRDRYIFLNNVMESSELTFSETKLVLLGEISITSAPTMDKVILKTVGHAAAFDYMTNEALKNPLVITEDIIKTMHYLLFNKMEEREAGQYRKKQSEESKKERRLPPPEEIPHFMEHLINQIESSKKMLHPIEFATMSHKRLLEIQPFEEGNEYIARLLLNLILVSAGYTVTTIPTELKEDYNHALMAAQKKDNPDIDRLTVFIAECVIESQRDYCSLLRAN